MCTVCSGPRRDLGTGRGFAPDGNTSPAPALAAVAAAYR